MRRIVKLIGFNELVSLPGVWKVRVAPKYKDEVERAKLIQSVEVGYFVSFSYRGYREVGAEVVL